MPLPTPRVNLQSGRIVVVFTASRADSRPRTPNNQDYQQSYRAVEKIFDSKIGKSKLKRGTGSWIKSTVCFLEFRLLYHLEERQETANYAWAENQNITKKKDFTTLTAIFTPRISAPSPRVKVTSFTGVHLSCFFFLLSAASSPSIKPNWTRWLDGQSYQRLLGFLPSISLAFSRTLPNFLSFVWVLKLAFFDDIQIACDLQESTVS